MQGGRHVRGCSFWGIANSRFSGLEDDFWLIIDAFCTIFHGEAEFDGISEKVHFPTGEA